MAKLLSLVIGLLLTLTIYVQAALADESSAVVDPLPSWNEGAAKQAIGEFVAKVIKPDSPDFVPITERIAVFDNDGTLLRGQTVRGSCYHMAIDMIDVEPTKLSSLLLTEQTDEFVHKSVERAQAFQGVRWTANARQTSF